MPGIVIEHYFKHCHALSYHIRSYHLAIRFDFDIDCFYSTLRNLGVYIDCDLSMRTHVTRWSLGASQHYVNVVKFDARCLRPRSRLWWWRWCIPGWITVMKCLAGLPAYMQRLL